jgi:hypothetical protein
MTERRTFGAQTRSDQTSDPRFSWLSDATETASVELRLPNLPIPKNLRDKHRDLLDLQILLYSLGIRAPTKESTEGYEYPRVARFDKP